VSNWKLCQDEKDTASDNYSKFIVMDYNKLTIRLRIYICFGTRNKQR